MPKPWDRQPGETGKAYAAFRAYLDLGEGRSIQAAWEAKNGTEKQPSGAFCAWAADNNWLDRASDYDTHLWQREQEAVQKEIVKQKARIGRRLGDLVDRLLGNALGENVEVTVGEDGRSFVIRPDAAEVGSLKYALDSLGWTVPTVAEETAVGGPVTYLPAKRSRDEDGKG